jgi:hypothetical protein
MQEAKPLFIPSFWLRDTFYILLENIEKFGEQKNSSSIAKYLHFQYYK